MSVATEELQLALARLASDGVVPLLLARLPNVCCCGGVGVPVFVAEFVDMVAWACDGAAGAPSRQLACLDAALECVLNLWFLAYYVSTDLLLGVAKALLAGLPAHDRALRRLLTLSHVLCGVDRHYVALLRAAAVEDNAVALHAVALHLRHPARLLTRPLTPACDEVLRAHEHTWPRKALFLECFATRTVVPVDVSAKVPRTTD